MRRWWNALGVLAGGLASLGGIASTASAQFPPPPGAGMGMPPGMMAPPPAGMGLPPGAGGMPPGAFGGNPAHAGMPAEFPNPAVPSQEPVSPFTIKDEGMPNAFSELHDPRGRRPQPYCVTFRFEYLNWQMSKGGSAADLVTTSSNFPTEFGALGQPGTTVLVPRGDNVFDYDRIQGGRASMGLAIGYLPPIEVSGFDFNRKTVVFQGGSGNATGQFLARPAQLSDLPLAPGIGTEDALFVNAPGLAAGSINITSRMSLWGIEANLLLNFCDTDHFKIDFVTGYRHAELYESLDITHRFGGIFGSPTFGGFAAPVGSSISLVDVFRTHNRFDGGQIGLRGIFTAARWSLFTDVKLAMGNTNNSLTIDGNTTLFQPAAGRDTQVLPGGMLALTTNSGRVTQNTFSILPEANATLSFQMTPNFRIFGGYTVLYWDNVVRPGDHVTNVIDSRQVPSSPTFNPNVTAVGPAFPAFVQRNFWAHGFNVGVEIGF